MPGVPAPSTPAPACPPGSRAGDSRLYEYVLARTRAGRGPSPSSRAFSAARCRCPRSFPRQTSPAQPSSTLSEYTSSKFSIARGSSTRKWTPGSARQQRRARCTAVVVAGECGRRRRPIHLRIPRTRTRTPPSKNAAQSGRKKNASSTSAPIRTSRNSRLTASCAGRVRSGYGYARIVRIVVSRGTRIGRVV